MPRGEVAVRCPSLHDSHRRVAFDRVADDGAARAHVRPQPLVLASRTSLTDHVRHEPTIGCFERPVRERVGARVERVEEHDGADPFAHVAAQPRERGLEARGVCGEHDRTVGETELVEVGARERGLPKATR